MGRDFTAPSFSLVLYCRGHSDYNQTLTAVRAGRAAGLLAAVYGLRVHSDDCALPLVPVEAFITLYKSVFDRMRQM